MDFKTFLEHFDTIAEAPGGIQKLRSLILDMAVRGKLVPQNPEDQLPSFTLNIDAKVEEIAYSIPSTWTWIQLGQVIKFVNGFAFKSSEFVDSGIGVVRIGDIVDGQVDDSSMKRVDPNYLKNLDHKFWVCPGDMLIAMSGATTGKLGFNRIQETFLLNQRVGKIIPTNIYGQYLYYFLNTQIKKNLEASFGSAIPNLSTQYINSIPTPLPPLAEQKRIVEKVDELMALCDRYEAGKQARDNRQQKLRESAIAGLMNAETDKDLDAGWAIVCDNWHNLSQHPEDVNSLRQSVLALAVRGKLISQNLNDECVLELLARITDEKKSLIQAKKIREASTLPLEDSAFPCEIPKSWVWKRFGDIILDIEAGTSPQCEKRPKDEDEWGVIKISAVSWDKFNPDENKALPANLEPRKEFEIKSGDFIMSRANTSQLVGKSVVVEHLLPRLLLNDKTLRLLFSTCIEKRFFNLYNNSDLARQYYASEGTGTSDSMKNITREQIRNLPVPVPPLHEQKRIVAKVDELMKLCDQLEESLRLSRQRAESLAASAISHLTI